MRFHSPAFVPIILLIGLWWISACDLTDDEVEPSEVAGEYVFTDFRFVPDSPLLPPVVILDTLVSENTRLQLFSSGRFTMLYQFEGQNPEFIGGDFDANESRVRLRGREDEERFFRQLLLGPEITLRREGADGFSASIARTVNLEEYSSRYRGLRSVEGTVVLVLTRR